MLISPAFLWQHFKPEIPHKEEGTSTKGDWPVFMKAKYNCCSSYNFKDAKPTMYCTFSSFHQCVLATRPQNNGVCSNGHYDKSKQMPKSEILSAKGANNPRGSHALHIKSWIMCHA